MDDTYGDEIKKMALIATSSQLAKETSVAKMGIGEDLNFNFFGWNEDTLGLICQLGYEGMRKPVADRFNQCLACCVAMRQYWGVSEITMVAEGFVSLDPMASKGKSLREMFAAGKGVDECLTVTHARMDGESRPVVSVVALPYSYNGKKISWKRMLAAPDQAISVLRESMFPAMLVRSLAEKEMPNSTRETRDSVARQMADDGFEIVDFGVE